MASILPELMFNDDTSMYGDELFEPKESPPFFELLLADRSYLKLFMAYIEHAEVQAYIDKDGKTIIKVFHQGKDGGQDMTFETPIEKDMKLIDALNLIYQLELTHPIMLDGNPL